MEQELAAGHLPNLTEWMVHGGVHFTHAITTFPSTTSTGYQGMVSGLFPGHAGIPYLEWFDRTKMRRVNFLSARARSRMDHSFRNWYDPHGGSLFDDLQPAPTAALFTIFSRSAPYHRPRFPPIAVGWTTFVTHHDEKLNRYAWNAVFKRFSDAHLPPPVFTFVGMLSTDVLGHHEGTNSAPVVSVLREFDAKFGEFVTMLQTRGMWNDTAIIITADHGMHDIHEVIDLRKLLQEAHLRVTPFGRTHYANVYLGARGVSVATLAVLTRAKLDDASQNIASEMPWLAENKNGATIDVAQLIAHDPRVDLLLARDPAASGEGEATTDHASNIRTVRLMNATARAFVQNRRGPQSQEYRYLASDTKNDLLHVSPLTPLAQRASLLIDGHASALHATRWCSAQTWNRILQNSEFPGSVPQLAQIFDDGHAGDLVVIAKSDFGFYHEKAATHGSHRAVDMRVPLLIHAPGLSAATRDTAQITDLYPTILQLLGKSPQNARIDGRSVFSAPLH